MISTLRRYGQRLLTEFCFAGPLGLLTLGLLAVPCLGSDAGGRIEAITAEASLSEKPKTPGWMNIVRLQFLNWDPPRMRVFPISPEMDGKPESKTSGTSKNLSNQQQSPSLPPTALQKKNSFLVQALWSMTINDKGWTTDDRLNQSLLFHLKSGMKLKALFFRKNHPAPLVVLRLGIFSQVTDFKPERFLASLYYEYMPFHLLILESTSNVEYIERNGRLPFLGIEEAWQNLEVAKLIRESDLFKDHIQSLHLVGMSLGGLGATYSALLQSDVVNGANHRFQSLTLFCPLLDLRNTIEFHQNRSFILSFIEFWMGARLAGQNPSNASLPLLQVFNQMRLTDTDLQLISAGYDQDPNRLGELQIHAGALLDIPSPKNLSHLIKIPTLVLATQQDWVVPYGLNSGQLSKNHKLITLEQGQHCSLPGAYEWHSLIPVLEESILQSAGLKKRLGHQIISPMGSIPKTPGPAITGSGSTTTGNLLRFPESFVFQFEADQKDQSQLRVFPLSLWNGLRAGFWSKTFSMEAISPFPPGERTKISFPKWLSAQTSVIPHKDSTENKWELRWTQGLEPKTFHGHED